MEVWVGPVIGSITKYPPKKARKTTEKSTDFVLVFKSTINAKSFQSIEKFNQNLRQKGFELRISTFTLNDQIVFIRIHAPISVLLYYAEIFGIELAFQSTRYQIEDSPPFKCMETELTNLAAFDILSRRIRQNESDFIITSGEKSLIIYKVLKINQFGQEKKDYGVEKLINSGIIETAYPLHDGDFEWSEKGQLNDRQLLAKYWSNLKCLFKYQPLDLIEKYYGPEVAFYFAWLGVYNKMLLLAATLSIIFLTLGVIFFHHKVVSKRIQICESNIYLCPRCIVENCRFEPLKTSCLFVNYLYILRNPFVISFAVVMCIWLSFFLELWKREEASLQVRWGLRNIGNDYSMRPEFEESAKHFRISLITGTVEPYMLKKELCCRYTVTFAAVLFLILLVVLGIFGVIVYIKATSVIITKQAGNMKLLGLVPSITGSIMSATFILIISIFYDRFATWLTQMENPRTQIDFDNSYIFKCYAIAFVNNYCVVFYIAFLKGRFYTYPGDEHLWTLLAGVGTDLCTAAGCIVDLSIQITVILTLKDFVMILQQYIVPKLLIIFKKFRKQKVKNKDLSLQWENDYLLNDIYKYHILGEQMQMVIQYGFVTFFIAAFPLAPVFAVIDNLFELRVDALKLTTAYKRPIAFKVPNMAAWNTIIQGITYLGIVTNAFIIAFTSEFVQRIIYKSIVKNETDKISHILSAYNISEFSMNFENNANLTVCYYPGMRYPPNHPRKYQLTDEYWHILAIKFLTVVIFEHMIVVITGIAAYAIPDVPFTVKEFVNYQKELQRNNKGTSYANVFNSVRARNRLNVLKDF